MTHFDHGEGAAAVARRNAYLQNQADADEARRRVRTEQDAERRRQHRMAGYSTDAAGNAVAPEVPGASALALARRADPAWRRDQAQARRRAEERARERAIYEAAHPKPKDPRSTAERLAAGEGQAHLDGKG